MKLISLITILTITIYSCAFVNNNKSNQSKLSSISSERLYGDVQFVYNSDSTKVICIGNKKNLGQTYSFFVYSVSSNQSITKTFNNVSEVKWDSNQSIKYKYLSGIVQAGEKSSKFTIINFKD